MSLFDGIYGYFYSDSETPEQHEQQEQLQEQHEQKLQGKQKLQEQYEQRLKRNVPSLDEFVEQGLKKVIEDRRLVTFLLDEDCPSSSFYDWGDNRIDQIINLLTVKTEDGKVHRPRDSSDYSTIIGEIQVIVRDDYQHLSLDHYEVPLRDLEVKNIHTSRRKNHRLRVPVDVRERDTNESS